MELQEFVTNALMQVIGAVSKVSKFAKEHGAEINPASLTWSEHQSRQLLYDNDTGLLCSEIEFDLAVTASSESSKEAEGGIFVNVLKLGASGLSKAGNQSISRIKFMVPVVLPSSKPEPVKPIK